MTIPPTKLNLIGGGVDISLPNVSYCEDVKDVHYLPYNLVRFYVGDITGTTPHTVSIYTDKTNHVDVQVSEGNKWYSYAIPKDKGLYRIEGDSVNKVIVKADISNYYNNDNGGHFPISTIEASFNGSNTSNTTNMSSMFKDCGLFTFLDLSCFDISNVTSMNGMFFKCTSLASLDLSGWDTSKVTSMIFMFGYCSSLKTIKMVGCSEDTIDKIKAQLTTDGISLDKVNIITE